MVNWVGIELARNHDLGQAREGHLGVVLSEGVSTAAQFRGRNVGRTKILQGVCDSFVYLSRGELRGRECHGKVGQAHKRVFARRALGSWHMQLGSCQSFSESESCISCKMESEARPFRSSQIPRSVLYPFSGVETGRVPKVNMRRVTRKVKLRVIWARIRAVGRRRRRSMKKVRMYHAACPVTAVTFD